MIQVRYFARYREELGVDAETIEATAAETVGALLSELHARGGVWSRIFAQDQRVMMAVNQELADAATPVKAGDEVAFFPPVTGG
jgi:molybdopterin synthase sulfur carrier subunit